jgi:hypothetical protein
LFCSVGSETRRERSFVPTEGGAVHDCHEGVGVTAPFENPVGEGGEFFLSCPALLNDEVCEGGVAELTIHHACHAAGFFEAAIVFGGGGKAFGAGKACLAQEGAQVARVERIAAVEEHNLFPDLGDAFVERVRRGEGDGVEVIVGDGENAAGFEDAPHFSDGAQLVAEMVEQGVGVDHIECCGVEAQFVDVALLESDVGEAAFLDVGAGDLELGDVHIHTDDVARRDEFGEVKRDGADAATAIEKGQAGFEVGEQKWHPILGAAHAYVRLLRCGVVEAVEFLGRVGHEKVAIFIEGICQNYAPVDTVVGK